MIKTYFWIKDSHPTNRNIQVQYVQLKIDIEIRNAKLNAMDVKHDKMTNAVKYYNYRAKSIFNILNGIYV